LLFYSGIGAGFPPSARGALEALDGPQPALRRKESFPARGPRLFFDFFLLFDNVEREIRRARRLTVTKRNPLLDGVRFSRLEQISLLGSADNRCYGALDPIHGPVHEGIRNFPPPFAHYHPLEKESRL